MHTHVENSDKSLTKGVKRFPKNSFTCNICGNTFKIKRDLQSHFQNVHTVKEPIKPLKTENSVIVDNKSESSPIEIFIKESNYEYENDEIDSLNNYEKSNNTDANIDFIDEKPTSIEFTMNSVQINKKEIKEKETFSDSNSILKVKTEPVDVIITRW